MPDFTYKAYTASEIAQIADQLAAISAKIAKQADNLRDLGDGRVAYVRFEKARVTAFEKLSVFTKSIVAAVSDAEDGAGPPELGRDIGIVQPQKADASAAKLDKTAATKKRGRPKKEAG